MSEVTVKQLAEVVKIPVNKLLVQLTEAGLDFSTPDQTVSDKQKMQLLNYLRNNRSKVAALPADDGRKIVLRRKSTSQLKVNTTQGRGSTSSTTVNVEVRRKRTYVKRSTVLEEEAKARQERAQQEAAREKEAAAQREKAAEEAAAKAKLAEQEKQKPAEEAAPVPEKEATPAPPPQVAEEPAPKSDPAASPEPVQESSPEPEKVKPDTKVKRRELH
ncbi:MAG: translation initiation factor IF-2, partial [Proteobacteria bacterium]|nr:translation initiation factor IF-2 [Pseudomonadota bacterium]